MELKPTKAQILWLAEKYNTVPLSTTLPATVTPTQVLQKLKTVSRHCYMLESCEDKESSGRYTFLGFDPQAEIHCKDGKGTVMDENGSCTFTGSPKPHIAALLERHKSPRLRELPTFTGGLVGYFAYDYAKYSEPRLELTAAEDGNFNDVDLMLFDKVIAFDHVKEEIILIFNMNTRDPEAGYRRGQKSWRSCAAWSQTVRQPPARRKHGCKRTLPPSLTRLLTPQWWRKPRAISGRAIFSRWCCLTA